jgi:hypothetical protein
MPDWTPIGPSPQYDTTGEWLTSKGYPQREIAVSGRIAALAYSPNVGGGRQALFLGTASGGIWRTGDFLPNSAVLALNATWSQVSDNLFTLPNTTAPRQMIFYDRGGFGTRRVRDT